MNRLKAVIKFVVYQYEWMTGSNWTRVNVEFLRDEHSSPMIPDELETWRHDITGEVRFRRVYR